MGDILLLPSSFIREQNNVEASKSEITSANVKNAYWKFLSTPVREECWIGPEIETFIGQNTVRRRGLRVQ
jgi:hypothetical protein